MSLSYDSRGAKRNFCEADVTNFMPKSWRKTSTYYPVWSMVQWAPKPTCERVRCSFLQLVACLKHRTNVRRKTNKQTSSVFLPTKDRGSQDVLGTLKPFRLCTVVLMLVPFINSVKQRTEQVLFRLASSILVNDLHQYSYVFQRLFVADR